MYTYILYEIRHFVCHECYLTNDYDYLHEFTFAPIQERSVNKWYQYYTYICL